MNYKSARHVLIAEAQAIIAMDLEQSLRDSGYESIAMATSCAEAEAELARQMPNIAVLDVDLLDGVCLRLAMALRERSVPFIVFSGRSDRSAVDPVFSHGTWLAKPATADVVVAAMEAILPHRGVT
ncbi:response regulator [Bosea massiliensis]|jgi:DNA-binding response OmpR family regulator|uniref:Response regulator n=1 Tax=Bosea massiliensis TaxID=151419 RepID=A0ABW0P105_9HYPH